MSLEAIRELGSAAIEKLFMTEMGYPMHYGAVLSMRKAIADALQKSAEKGSPFLTTPNAPVWEEK